MPKTPAHSPNGTNKANMYLPDNFYGYAYDAKGGLQQDDARVARLRAKLGQDGLNTLKKLMLAMDEEGKEENSSPAVQLSDLLNRVLKGEELSQAMALLDAISGPAEDANDNESEERNDQPPPFEGRPTRDKQPAMDSRSRLPAVAMDTSQGEGVKRLRGLMDRVGVA